MTFPERLVELRVENGYSTRTALAEKMGIPVTTLKHYEDGDREPGHTFLKAVSELFNVSVDYLLGLTDEKEVLHPFRVTTREQGMIEKYRSLDDHGTKVIDSVLDLEYARCTATNEKAQVVEFSLERGSGRLVARNGHDLTDGDKQEIINIANRWIKGV